MKLTPKIKLLIITVLGIAIISVMILFVILPQQENIISLGEDIYDQRVNYEFITQQRQDLVHLEREIKEIITNHDKVSSMLFSQQDTLELITALENIAHKNGISNQNLNLSNPTTVEPDLFVSSITIGYNSSYSNIINWALAIEQQPFYLIIDSMTLSKTNASTSTTDNVIDVQIAARIYWQ